MLLTIVTLVYLVSTLCILTSVLMYKEKYTGYELLVAIAIGPIAIAFIIACFLFLLIIFTWTCLFDKK